MKTECKGCTKRHAVCHDHCESYQAALKEHLEIKRRKAKANALDEEFIQMRIYGCEKARRKKG